MGSALTNDCQKKEGEEGDSLLQKAYELLAAAYYAIPEGGLDPDKGEEIGRAFRRNCNGNKTPNFLGLRQDLYDKGVVPPSERKEPILLLLRT